MNIDGSQVVMLAGVGPGLGAALAHLFAKQGYAVGLMARNTEYINQLESELVTSGYTATALTADLTNSNQVRSAFSKLRERFGLVEILINHGGLAYWKGILEVSPEEFEQVWRVSVLGALLCCQEVVPNMQKKGKGTILFSGATSTVRGRKGAIDFSSAQFARRGLADAMARELWPQGIHVAHIIIDGVINTPRVRKQLTPDPDEPLLDPAEIAKNYWHLVQQQRNAWTFELDLRPNREAFFE